MFNRNIYMLASDFQGSREINSKYGFFTSYKKAFNFAVKVNIKFIQKYFTDNILVFEEGYDEYTPNYINHLLDYRKDSEKIAKIAASGKQSLPILFTVVKIEYHR